MTQSKRRQILEHWAEIQIVSDIRLQMKVTSKDDNNNIDSYSRCCHNY